MSDSFAKAIVVVVLVAALIGVIIFYNAKNEADSEKRIQARLDEFMDEIQTTGTLTEQRYNEFFDFLSNEGSGVQIEIENIVPADLGN